MRKITLIDIFNPTKLRDWLNELMTIGGTKGEKGDRGEPGDSIKSIKSQQHETTVTLTITLTSGAIHQLNFDLGA